jgi:hypothetical protein
MTLQNIYLPEQWHDFFELVGTGAVALTGLLYVAMSPHLEVIINDSSLRHRALSILTGLGAAFMRCGLVLMGGQNRQAVGVELLIICAFGIGIGINSFFHAFKHSRDLHKNVFYRTLMSVGCYTIEMLGAVILISGYILGMYIAAIALVINFYFWISGSWLLLVGILHDEAHHK